VAAYLNRDSFFIIYWPMVRTTLLSGRPAERDQGDTCDQWDTIV
jgi:hypothetical protein